jgi:hypothetical protein
MAGSLEHDPEKCAAVFRKDHAQTTGDNQDKEKAPALSAPGLETQIDLRPRRVRA